MARNVTIYTAAPPPTLELVQTLPGVEQVKVEKKLFRAPTGFHLRVQGRNATIAFLPATQLDNHLSTFSDHIRRLDRTAPSGPATSIGGRGKHRLKSASAQF